MAVPSGRRPGGQNGERPAPGPVGRGDGRKQYGRTEYAREPVARGGGGVVSAGRRRDIYLVAQELHLALGQLLALVQLLNPLV